MEETSSTKTYQPIKYIVEFLFSSYICIQLQKKAKIMSNLNYPLKFKPILKEKIWGGHRLSDMLNKEIGSLPNAGESWEISAVDGNISMVTNGCFAGISIDELLRQEREKLIGQKNYEMFGNNFPLLIKFIDAADKLSIQVHPNNEVAKRRHNASGKSEVWYVINADDNSELISGFSKPISYEEYKELLDRGAFAEVLNRVRVQRGDMFFIPAGRIHGICKDTMVAEIQQTSDITYRVYDYKRKDSNGKERQLHVEEAAEALNFNDTDNGKFNYSLKPNECVKTVSCPYFKTGVTLVRGETKRDYSELDSFVILIGVRGNTIVNGVELKYGETMLIPASLKAVDIIATDAEILEVYI